MNAAAQLLAAADAKIARDAPPGPDRRALARDLADATAAETRLTREAQAIRESAALAVREAEAAVRKVHEEGAGRIRDAEAAERSAAKRARAAEEALRGSAAPCLSALRDLLSEVLAAGARGEASGNSRLRPVADVPALLRRLREALGECGRRALSPEDPRAWCEGVAADLDLPRLVALARGEV